MAGWIFVGDGSAESAEFVVDVGDVALAVEVIEVLSERRGNRVFYLLPSDHGGMLANATPNARAGLAVGQSDKDRLLCVEAIFGLLENRVGVELEGGLANLLFAVCGETVEDDVTGGGGGE